MEEQRPRLVAVDPEGAVGSPAESPRREPSRRPLRTRLPWLLGVLLVFACIALGLEFERAHRLQDQVTALETELAATRTELRAHQRHLEAVRGAVEGVRSQLTALEEIVARDPAAAPSEPTP